MRLKLLFVLSIFTNILLGNNEVPPPSNDNFANAIPITCGNNYTGSTAEATIDEDNAPDATNPQVVDLDAPNIWYSYTGSGTTETVTLDLCASGYDSSFLVYTGTSGNLSLVAANDFNEPVCGPGFRSYGTFQSDGTTTYYITITGYNSSDVGDVNMTVSCEEIIPTPNTIELAIPIVPSPAGTGCTNGYVFDLDFTNSGTTDSGLGGCLNGDFEGIDQFFTWTATTNGLKYSTPSFVGRAGMIIRNATAPYEIIDCSKALDNNDGIFTGWNVGDNLIIQIYKSEGFSGIADARFCLEEKSFSTPNNDLPAGAIPIVPGLAGSDCTITTNNQTLFLNTDTYTTTDSGMDNCVGVDTGVDQFFTWTATSGGLLWGQNPDNIGISVRSTTGVEYGCIVTNQGDPVKLSGWEIGEDLIIQLFNYENYHYDSLTFCLREYETPANNILSGATPITPTALADDCTETTLFFSSDGTTDSGLDGTCNGANTGYDQFFTWTATTNALSWTGLTENPGIIIRDTAGNEITCADTIAADNTILSGWEVGDELIIQIYDWVFIINSGTAAGNVEDSYRDISFCLKEHEIQITYVPDDNFEQALIDLGYDSVLDDYVSTANISGITSLNVSEKNITDLTGIEDFTSLEELRCERNGLTALDVSQNLALKILRCGNGPAVVPNPNQITSLDVSQNVNLEVLECDNNPINTLDVSLLPNLVTLDCIRTGISSLDVTQNTNLESLSCGYNNLTTLDVSQNALLKTMYLISNQLTSLDISNSPLLQTLYVGSNPLTSIDLSTNTALTFLWVSNTQLSSLDLSNNTLLESLYCTTISQLTSLNIANGANEDITTFWVFNTPNLDCVEVDNVDYSTANWNDIDTGLTFSLTCIPDPIPGQTYVPDNNFEQALIDLGLDTTLDNYVTTTNINTVNDLNIRNLGIFDLTGIEDFAALEILNCGLNILGELDLSNNTNLNYLIADSAALTALNVQNGNNTNVTTFITLGNVDLFCIQVDDAAYSTANWTTIESGTSFSTNCGAPENDECTDATNIPISDVGCNTTVSGTLTRATDSNSLHCFGDSPNFTDVWFSFVATETIHNIALLNTTGLSNTVFHALIDAQTYNCGNITDAIYCSDELQSQATGLTIGNTYYIQVYSDLANSTETFDICVSSLMIPGLTYVPDDNFEQALIDLGYDTVLDNYVTTTNINSVTSLDVIGKSIVDLTGIEGFAALEELFIDNNNISTTVNLTQNPLLKTFYADNNTMTTLDVSQNPLLEILYFGGNSLTSLDVTQNPALKTLFIDNNSLSTIDVTQNPLLRIIGLASNNLGALDITQNPSLTFISASGNSLSTIDLSQNTALVQAYLSNNQLSAINVSQNILLEDLGVFSNPQIPSIDVSTNTNLKSLNISFTQISNIDVSNNLLLESLSFVNCPITQIDVSVNSALKSLSIAQSLVTSVDVSQNPAFEWISCRNTPSLRRLNMQNGNNSNVILFLATNTPNLECVQVDNVAYSTTNWTNITSGTIFSIDCGFLENDECANAISVPISDATCNMTVSGTLADATNSNAYNCFGSTDFSDVWFSFVATETTHNIQTLNTSGTNSRIFHAVIDAQTYTCGNITDAIYCTDDTQGIATGLTVGNTYYIQVYTDVASSTETFDVCVSTNSIAGQTYVPDNNFEQALIDLGLDTVLDDYVTTTNINTVNDLNIRNLSIFDLTGIEDFAALETLNCGLNFLGELDLSNNTNLSSLIADNAGLIGLNVKNGNNTNITTFITLGNVDLFCVQVDDAAYSTTNWTLVESTTSFSEYCGNPIQLAAKVYLQGAVLGNTDGFMRTDLKDNDHILTVSPYADGLTILATDPVFTATGQDKIVDWIWIELRDATNPSTIIDGKSALLQRDGDIIEALADNTSTPVSFNQEPGDYYIVIKHRNHLGIMSDIALSLSSSVLVVDFTDRNNQVTYGANAQTNFGMPADIVAMWCGNVNGDNLVQYSGTNPDAPTILSTVLNDPSNFLNFPTFTITGYDVNDVNMDGSIQYTGTNPDTPFILQNVLSHPGNFLNFSTFQITAQLPENE